MVLKAGSNPIETIKHPGEFDTMLKTVLYPKDFDSVSGWIPDVGDGSVLKAPVRNLANDADLARVRVVARYTIERVARAANHGFEKRVLQYNNDVENNRVAMNQIQNPLIHKVQKADDAKVAEERRHNLALEKKARGSGVGEMIGTIKEFGKRFGEETKKTVKQGFNKLVDSIDTGEVKVKHKEIFPNNPITPMCICGSSGSGKTHLTFNMLTTPNLLDFDSLYIYTTTPEQSYYQFLKALEYLPKKDV
ncbi:hypothetical protein LOTGIDRAFT_172057 [Lottia gigantea]|uniref:Uncharacterized protein n=1 Tax=Lottia gigantea TaxID=225164 RepID=V4AEH4_LOTGI|nr:hypothetical protein LOTGIDRAFT_172057 [Lottia gigantea]ESP02399.1 hypothetical protein LOTGIDRAFT_172057 [Lottia gigantea]